MNTCLPTGRGQLPGRKTGNQIVGEKKGRLHSMEASLRHWVGTLINRWALLRKTMEITPMATGTSTLLTEQHTRTLTRSDQPDHHLNWLQESLQLNAHTSTPTCLGLYKTDRAHVLSQEISGTVENNTRGQLEANCTSSHWVLTITKGKQCPSCYPSHLGLQWGHSDLIWIE